VVKVPPGKEVGEFANAFRILRDGGTEWLLDFLVYSAQGQTAVVVSRLRVQQEFLPAMRDRLEGTLTEVTTPDLALAPPTDEEVQH